MNPINSLMTCVLSVIWSGPWPLNFLSQHLSIKVKTNTRAVSSFRGTDCITAEQLQRPIPKAPSNHVLVSLGNEHIPRFNAHRYWNAFKFSVLRFSSVQQYSNDAVMTWQTSNLRFRVRLHDFMMAGPHLTTPSASSQRVIGYSEEAFWSMHPLKESSPEGSILWSMCFPPQDMSFRQSVLWRTKEAPSFQRCIFQRMNRPRVETQTSKLHKFQGRLLKDVSVEWALKPD